jgi:hypothetical protein
MAEKKYEKNIITGVPPGLEFPKYMGGQGPPPDMAKFMMWMGDDVIKGSPYAEAVWFWPRAIEPGERGVPEHVHDYDEVLGFFGTKREDVYDLGGEIEFWLSDEKYMLTKSCLIYVPKGLKHGPLFFRRVDRPIFHFFAVTSPTYERK